MNFENTITMTPMIYKDKLLNVNLITEKSDKIEADEHSEEENHIKNRKSKDFNNTDIEK